MNRTRQLLEALADLLTEAVPLERERVEQRPYETDHGTRLEFREPRPSETKYQPGNWTEGDRTPVRPLVSEQAAKALGISLPRVLSAVDELLEEQELRPAVRLYSARRAVLTYAADLWYAFGSFPVLKQASEGFTGWPLDLPVGQRLVVRSDLFPNADSWIGWGKCAADFPRLVNDTAVKEWIAREAPPPAAGDTGKSPESITKSEADKLARELADKRVIHTGEHARVEDWAGAIRRVTGKTCSTSTVGKTDFWHTHGHNRGSRGRPDAEVVSLTPGIESTVGAGIEQEVLDQLVDETEEKAVEAVMGSKLPDQEKATIVNKLREGEITAAKAKDLVAAVAEQAGDSEPSPLEPDPPDKRRRVRGRKRL
jgi:hypothetical protein